MDIGRRSFLKLSSSLGIGLALGEYGFNVSKIEASVSDFKLRDAKEFTSNCTFCSCNCGMVCSVKDGKLINLEGDPDHIVNEGALCPKGAGMSVIPNSDQRIKTPLYRAPGSDKWQEISWDEAFEKIVSKIKDVRDKDWIEKETVDGTEYVVNRCDGLSFLGGAQNNNEECYLFVKMARLLGASFIEHQARL